MRSRSGRAFELGAAIAVLVGALAAWGTALAAGVAADRSSEPAAAIAAAGAACGLAVVLAWSVVRRLRGTVHELAETRRSLTTIVLTTHDVLWRTTPDGQLGWVTEGVESLLGYSRSDLLGRQVTDLLDPAQRPLWSRQMREYVRACRGWQDVPLRLRCADGTSCLVETSAEPILDRRGQVSGYEGTARAVSGAQAEQIRLAEQRLRVSALLTHRSVDIALQPIVSLTDGKVIGVEALTRFGTEPYLPPDVWFARAAEVGLGVALELQSLRAALDALPQLPPDIFLSLNASPTTVVDPAFAELLLDPATPLPRLMLEITEHESISDYALLCSMLATARDRGLRLAVDDAGAGYASFRHIVQLRPDHIKLDRDLTAGIDQDPARRALASAVVLFALELDASVTAEGVETSSQLDTLRSLGVDAAQGYYLGPPVADRGAWRSWRGRYGLSLLGRSAG